MMTATTSDLRSGASAHLTDGELMFLAGALDDADPRTDGGRRGDATPLSLARSLWSGAHAEARARMAHTAHLDGCAECRERLGVLERRGRRLAARIAELDFPADFRRPTLSAARPRPSGAGWIRAAAVLLVVIAPLLLVPPARAWALGWVRARWAQVTTGRIAPATTQAPRAAVSADTTRSRIRFVPTTDEIAIEFAAQQARGALLLSATSETSVVFEVVDGTGDEVPLVHEGGLRVLNTPISGASYRVALPPATQRVRLLVGTRAPVLIERTQLERERRLTLR